MVDHEQVEAGRFGPSGSDRAQHDHGADPGSTNATSTREHEQRRIVVPTAPGWAWLAGVVAVSLVMWAGIIWVVSRILR